MRIKTNNIVLGLTFLSLSFTSFSQTEIKMKDGVMMVQEVKNIEGFDSLELFKNTLKWAEESQVASLDITKKTEGKLIEGRGVIESTYFLGNSYSELVFDTKIEFKEGRFRITCTQILVSDLNGKTFSLETNLYSNTGEEITNRKARKYRAEANRAFSQMLKDLSVFLKMDEEFSDW